MESNFLPTQTDDAARQQLVSNAFYFVADFLAGADSAPRVDSQTVRADGLLGPNNNNTDVAVGANGDLFIRGRSGLYSKVPQGATTAGVTPNAPLLAGLGISPGLLMLAIAGFFLLRHR